MIRVAVPDEHVAHVVRVEADSTQLRQEHGLELVGIAGVDQQNAVRRRQRPDDGARAAERVQVVEHARRSDLRVVGAVGAARVAAEELDGFAPFAAGSGARPIDDGRYGGRIGRGGCRCRSLGHRGGAERAREQRCAEALNHGSLPSPQDHSSAWTENRTRRFQASAHVISGDGRRGASVRLPAAGARPWGIHGFVAVGCARRSRSRRSCSRWRPRRSRRGRRLRARRATQRRSTSRATGSRRSPRTGAGG